MRLETIMTTPVETVSPRASIRTAQRILKSKGIHHLVVLDHATILGLVTADTLKDREAAGATLVADAMIRNITMLSPTMTVRQAVDLMIRHDQSAVPILRNHELIGIVTISDLLDLAGTLGDREGVLVVK